MNCCMENIEYGCCGCSGLSGVTNLNGTDILGRKLSKGAKDALISGGMAIFGWVILKKYYPEYAIVGALAGNALGNLLSELLEPDDFFDT